MRRRALLLLSTLGCALPAQALYDPKPVSDIALLQGEWHGSLTYNDYSRPGKLVTLPTKLFAALSSPTELTLHYVYDDGPGKTVYSYERMRFQQDGAAIVLATAGAKPSERMYTVVSNNQDGNVKRIVFERAVETKKDRLILEVSPSTLSLKKEELEGENAAVFRNEYKLRRGGA